MINILARLVLEDSYVSVNSIYCQVLYTWTLSPVYLPQCVSFSLMAIFIRQFVSSTHTDSFHSIDCLLCQLRRLLNQTSQLQCQLIDLRTKEQSIYAYAVGQLLSNGRLSVHGVDYSSHELLWLFGVRGRKNSVQRIAHFHLFTVVSSEVRPLNDCFSGTDQLIDLLTD